MPRDGGAQGGGGGSSELHYRSDYLAQRLRRSSPLALVSHTSVLAVAVQRPPTQPSGSDALGPWQVSTTSAKSPARRPPSLTAAWPEAARLLCARPARALRGGRHSICSQRSYGVVSCAPPLGARSIGRGSARGLKPGMPWLERAPGEDSKLTPPSPRDPLRQRRWRSGCGGGGSVVLEWWVGEAAGGGSPKLAPRPQSARLHGTAG